MQTLRVQRVIFCASLPLCPFACTVGRNHRIGVRNDVRDIQFPGCPACQAERGGQGSRWRAALKYLVTLPCFIRSMGSMAKSIKNLLKNVHPACPACPVAPGDGTGVGMKYRTGVKCFFSFI